MDSCFLDSCSLSRPHSGLGAKLRFLGNLLPDNKECRLWGGVDFGYWQPKMNFSGLLTTRLMGIPKSSQSSGRSSLHHSLNQAPLCASPTTTDSCNKGSRLWWTGHGLWFCQFLVPWPWNPLSEPQFPCMQNGSDSMSWWCKVLTLATLHWDARSASCIGLISEVPSA